MSAVSPATAAALVEAMQRLLEGRPARTDGALTIANLAREAGVSRATANRATDILARFRDRLVQADGEDLPATLRGRIRDLTAQVAELRRYEHQEVADLRATVSTLAQHVQALTLENQALRDAMERDVGVARMSDSRRGPHRVPGQPGDPEPGYHASILIDEVSFTELRFRQLLCDGNAPQPPGPRSSEGAS